MTFFYISDDLENDVRRCIQSWERQYPIAIRGLTVEVYGNRPDNRSRLEARHRQAMARAHSGNKPSPKTIGLVGGTST
jgi:hypothetical protein